MKRIATLLAVASLAGCSFMVSRPPHRNPVTGAPPRCGPFYAAPVIDSAQAAGGLILALAAFSDGGNQMAELSERNQAGLVGAMLLATTGVYVASAIRGFSRASECERMDREPTRFAPPPPPAPPSTEAPDTWPPEVEEHVDVDEDQIDIHTTIRRPQ